jgi:hypothetical protein
VAILAGCYEVPTRDPVSSETVIGRVTLGGDSLTVVIGESITVQASVYDVRGTPLDPNRLPGGQVLLWNTTNVNIATVADGLIRGVGPGRAIISANAGGQFAAVRVGVIPKTP